MEFRMLAEIKVDIKPEAAVPDLDKQLKDVQERLQAQTVLPPKTSEINTVNQPEEQVVNFGWEEIKDFPILPFIKRQTENYVANQIVTELVYKNIRKEFTNEMLFCMELISERMTQKEADTFNEINITHCDRSVVGDHNFKANEFMFKLEHVNKLIDYYKACKNLVLHKIKDNNLFGFVLIAGTDVPFIYSDSRQLVPLFYFEGQSQYLDNRSIDLTDPFKIGYLKFCCKIQKISKLYFEFNPLKVVDLEDVQALFPVGTTFSNRIPESVNEELLAPEIRLARLYGLEEERPVSPDRNISISSPSNPVEEKINNVPSSAIVRNISISSPSYAVEEEINKSISSTLPSSEIVRNTSISLNKTSKPPTSGIETSENNQDSDYTLVSENSLIESGKEKKNNNDPVEHKTLETEFIKYKEHMRRNRKPVKRSPQAIEKTEAKRYKIDEERKKEVNTLVQSSTITTKGIASDHLSKSGASLLQSKNTQLIASETLLQSQDRSLISQEFTVTPIQRIETNKQKSISDKRASGFATGTSMVALPSTLSRPNQNVQVTNVPYQSPQGASSPGLPQVTQVNEAAQRVAGYSQATMPGIESHQPVTIGTTYPPSTNLHQNHLVSHTGNQLSYTAQYYLNGVDVQQQNSVPYSVAKESSDSEPYYQPSSAQVPLSQFNFNPKSLDKTNMQYQYTSNQQDNTNMQYQYRSSQQNREIQTQNMAPMNMLLMQDPRLSNQQNREIQTQNMAPMNMLLMQDPRLSNQQNREIQTQNMAPMNMLLMQDQRIKEQQTQQYSFALHSTTNQVTQQISIHRPQQQMMQPSSFSLPQQLAMQQTGSYSCPPGLNIRNQAFHTMPASNTGPYYQQYANPSGVVVQNVNRSYTNNTLPQNYVQNNYPAPAISANMMPNTNLFNNQDINNNRNDEYYKVKNSCHEPKILVLTHPKNTEPDPDFYKTTVITVKRKLLLGINKYTYGNNWIVNLSEFVEKVLGLNPFVNQAHLLCKFVTLFKLNPVQKVKWDKVSQDKQLQYMGPFKDLFIDYKEIRVLGLT